MSNHLYRPAYATRLGNLTAKSVLVLLCDQANDEGLGWPSVASIVKGTEINRRTVLRIIEVFVAMGLIERVGKIEVADRFGRRTVEALRVNINRLEMDLTEEFAKAYAASQGKVAELRTTGRWCLRDAEGDVSETQGSVSETDGSVSETRNCVSETLPPDPLIGRPLIDPFPDPSLTPLACAGETPPLDREQGEHVEELRRQGRRADAAMWEAHYCEQNLREQKSRLDAAEAERAKDDAHKAEFGQDLDSALARLRKRCGFAWSDGDELGPVLRQVIADQLEMGKPVWRTAGQMAAMWELQRAQGKKLRARYGPLKFFRDGHWIDSAGWHWNVDELKRLEEVTAGSVHD